MTDQEKKEVQDLSEKGHSVRDIAAKTGVKRSTVHNVLKEHSRIELPDDEILGTLTDESEKPSRPNKSQQESGQALGILKEELSHEREMTKLSLQAKELKLKRRDIELREAEVETSKQQLEAQKKIFRENAVQENEKIESRKRVYVGRFNRIVDELLDNCSAEDTWTVDEVADLLDRAETLLDKVTVFADYHDIDVESLAISTNLEELIDYVEENAKKKSGLFSSIISFNADKEQEEEIESWKVACFDEELNDEEDEDDEDEDEDEEDEDDDEDEDDEDEDEEDEEDEDRKRGR